MFNKKKICAHKNHLGFQDAFNHPSHKMHAAGLHSALAIKRQRKRRDEQRRAKERRFSTHSTESGLTSPHNSIGSLHKYHPASSHRHGSAGDTKVVSSIGMLHIGVVFLVLGLFLLFSGLIPDDWSSFDSAKWWNELVATGAFFTGVGVFLVVVHFIISKQEDDELNAYVQSQLTRSRSGHRLERDTETGGLTTRHHRRARAQKELDLERGLDDFSPLEDDVLAGDLDYPKIHSPLKHTDSTHHHHIEINGHLTKIIEEETPIVIADRFDDSEIRKIQMLEREALSTSTTASLSPGSMYETQELITSNNNFDRYFAAAKV